MTSQLTTSVPICEARLSQPFNDPRRLAEALNASGNPGAFRDGFVNDYKRLATYGDTVLAARLAHKWVQTTLSRGFWSQNLQQTVLTNANLARIADTIDLGSLIDREWGTSHASTMVKATALEAIIGAVHIDAGDAAVDALMARLGITSDLLEQAIQEQGGMNGA